MGVGIFFKSGKFIFLVISVLLWSLLYNGFYDLVWVFLVPVFFLIKSLNSLKQVLIYSTILVLIIALPAYHAPLVYGAYLFSIMIILLIVFVITFNSSIFLLLKAKNVQYLFFVPALVWLSLVFLFDKLPYGSFWISLYSFVRFHFLFWLGPYVIIFVVLSVNFILYLLLQRKSYKKFFIVLAFIAISLLVYSFVDLNNDSDDSIKVALIQTNNMDMYYKRSSEISEVYSVLENMTYDVLDESPDLIVWPEYAVPTVQNNEQYWISHLSNFSKEIDKPLLTGLKHFELKSSYGNVFQSSYDAAFLFYPNGSYEKHLAITPYPNGFVSSGGEEVHVFETPFGSFAIVLCFDDNFAMFYTNYKGLDIDLIFAMVNDRDVSGSNGRYLHFLGSKSLAKFLNVPVARVANTGLSAVISKEGKVVSEIPPGEEGILIYDIPI